MIQYKHCYLLSLTKTISSIVLVSSESGAYPMNTEHNENSPLVGCKSIKGRLADTHSYIHLFGVACLVGGKWRTKQKPRRTQWENPHKYQKELRFKLGTLDQWCNNTTIYAYRTSHDKLYCADANGKLIFYPLETDSANWQGCGKN